jgi:general secretion pathway protein K
LHRRVLGEDDIYRTFDDPYRIKNAPFDSIEELRLIRGMSDDVWATFIEPEPDNIHARQVTIYGSGWINPNEAAPQVLLARLCAFARDQALCNDPMSAASFVQLVSMARAFAPIPWFSTAEDFVSFVEGKGGEQGLYTMLVSLLGPTNPLLFPPLILTQEARAQLLKLFVPSAAIFSIQSTGIVGRAKVRIRAVVNTHDRWTPPPPNAGIMPGLGVLHYYRVD